MSKIEFGGMTRWSGRYALVTGCSSGIGAAVAKDLLRYGVNVIGCGRDAERLNQFLEECSRQRFVGNFIPHQCDVAKPSEIEKMFVWIDKNYGGVDICINSAGVGTLTPILEMSATDMLHMVNVNIVGLTLCAQLAVSSMLSKRMGNGHVFNISSMLGHNVTGAMNFYSATKHAVTALSKGLRMEIAAKGSRIKISQISPGRVESGFHAQMFGEDKEMAQRFYENLENLYPQDVSDAVIHALSAGDNCQIYDILLQPTELGASNLYKTFLAGNTKK